MKFLPFRFFAVASAAVLSANGREIPQKQTIKEKQPFANGVADCAAIEAATLPDGTMPGLRGNLTFLGPIDCQVPTSWAVQADTVIESQTPIDMMNLVFIVYPDVRLVFRAPSVSLKRGEELQEMGEEILSNIGGTVEFQVSAPHLSYDAGSEVDEHGLVIQDSGKLVSNQALHFTDVEIVVAAPTDPPTDPTTDATSSIASKNDHNNLDDIGSNNGDNSAIATDAGDNPGSPRDTTTPPDSEKEPFPADASPSPTPIPHTGSTTSDEPHMPHTGSGNQPPPTSSPNAGTSLGEEERAPFRDAWTQVRPMLRGDSGNRSTPASTLNPGTYGGKERAPYRNVWTQVRTKPRSDSGDRPPPPGPFSSVWTQARPKRPGSDSLNGSPQAPSPSWVRREGAPAMPQFMDPCPDQAHRRPGAVNAGSAVATASSRNAERAPAVST